MANNDTHIIRVVFQILEPGDLKKMKGESNVSPTGGGAVDLRFRPDSAFLPMFRRMLPEVVLAHGKETYRGAVFWEASGQEKSREMAVWPATPSREGECRIAEVNHFDFSGLVKEDPGGGRSIFMLFQLRSGIVRAYFTTETSLKSEAWHSIIKRFAKDWMGTNHRSAFLDLETKERFPS